VDLRVLRLDGEHDHLDLWAERPNPGEAPEAVEPWQVHADEHDVRLEASHERHELRAVARRADDLEVAVALERVADAAQQQRLIVCDQDLHVTVTVGRVRVEETSARSSHPLPSS